MTFRNKESEITFTVVAVLVWSVVVGLMVPSCTYGDTNSIPAPPATSTNSAVEHGSSEKIKIITVYESEIVTNADHSTTWIKYATQANYVDRYPKQLYIQPMRKNDLTLEWEEVSNCQPFIVQLGFSETNEFFTSKMWIE